MFPASIGISRQGVLFSRLTTRQMTEMFLSPSHWKTRTKFSLDFNDPSSPLGPLQVGFLTPYMQIHGNPGIVYVPVQLSHVSDKTVTVFCYPREGPVTNNYICHAATLNFMPGSQSQSIPVQILANRNSSGFTMHIDLAGPMNADLGLYHSFSLGVTR